MVNYMKGDFDFLGIKKPSRTLFKKNKRIRNNSKELWKLPQREFQYFAMELLSVNEKKYRKLYRDLPLSNY